jgi:hypothetical protein
MTKFSDDLFTDLMREHGPALQNAVPIAPPGGRPHTVRRLALAGGGAGALAVGLTVGLTAAGGGVAPAYAVTQHPDGTLTVAVKQLSGVPGLNQKLQALGKFGQRVVVVPVRAGCPSIESLPAPKVNPPGKSASGKAPAGRPPVVVIGNKDGSVVVSAQDIPAGDLMVLAVSRTANSIQMSARLTSPPVPGCVSLPRPTPGNTVHIMPGPHEGPVTRKSGSS